MPDFFDRLVARDAHVSGAGSSAAARAADLERRAGVIRVTPRAPMRFEWPTVAGPEEVEETDSTPGWPPHAVEPTRPLVSAPPPAATAERLGHAQTGQAPGAHRGGDRDLWPPPPLLVPPALPAPATGPAATDAPEAFARPQPHPVAPVADTARDRDAGPAAPAPGPAAVPAPHPLPYRLAAPAAATAPAREAAAPAGRAQRHAAARPPERVVQVRIGRIDVRPAEQAERRQPVDRAPGRPAPQLSLDRFLTGEGGGGR